MLGQDEKTFLWVLTDGSDKPPSESVVNALEGTARSHINDNNDSRCEEFQTLYL